MAAGLRRRRSRAIDRAGVTGLCHRPAASYGRARHVTRRPCRPLAVPVNRLSSTSLIRRASHLTLAERWNGTSWAVQPTPNLTGATQSELSGVSCASTRACSAVGYYYNSSGDLVTLAERWNGTSWAVQPTPNPTGAMQSELWGVSCPSASACSAVGYYATADSERTLAEHD